MDDHCIYPGVSQYTGRHWLKWGMKRFYNVDYTHAWIGFRLGGVPLVYHSTGFGVHVQGWQPFLDERVIRHAWRVPLEPDVFQQFAELAFKETGKRYGNRQLYGIAVVKALSAIGIRLKRLPFGANRDKEHVCSETAGRVLMNFTPITWGEKDPDIYTPLDFYESCCALERMGRATPVSSQHPLFYPQPLR